MKKDVQLMGITHAVERRVEHGKRRYVDRDYLCLDLSTGSAPSAMESGEEDVDDCRYQLLGGRWLYRGARLPEGCVVYRLVDDEKVIALDDEATVPSPRKIPFTSESATNGELYGAIYWDAGTTTEVFLDQRGWFHYDPPECLRSLMGHPGLSIDPEDDEFFYLTDDDGNQRAELDLTCSDDDVARMLFLSFCEESTTTTQCEMIQKAGIACLGDNTIEAMVDFLHMWPSISFDDFWDNFDSNTYDSYDYDDEYVESWEEEVEHLEEPHWRSE